LTLSTCGYLCLITDSFSFNDGYCGLLHLCTGNGVPASRGVVTAPVVFSSAECMERSMRGDVILCLHECFPVDARSLRAAAGVITMAGSIFR
jgi:hypothetical protein